MPVYSFNILGLSSELSVYDKNIKYGYLSRYFTPVTQSKQNPFMTVEEYRNLTYSPNILNYKEGTSKAIDVFVKGMKKFLDKILETHDEGSAILIPIPSSKAKNDPLYNSQPKGVKFNRNRDNRNIIFVNRICDLDSKYKCVEGISRVASKKEKEKISVYEYMDSLEVNHVEKLQDECVILIDDIKTNGTTFEACASLIKKAASPKIVITVAIGQTRTHESFKSAKKEILEPDYF
ncbi:phosphoribosyltransferase [Leptospira alexanderi]|uniref:phosphoribosyltransferase n=1 Tax=Leptospira alexanderi TaxID=100053 RepID=UPI000991380F|nr:phosphoribosyltransferase [Leptospira alexanderi]